NGDDIVAAATSRARACFLDEQISYTAYGLDTARFDGIITDFRADPGHANVNGTILPVVLNASECGKNLFPAQHPPGITGQQPEQVEFSTGEVDTFATQPGLTHGTINHQVVELQTHRLLPGRLLSGDWRSFHTAQHGTNPGQQDARLDRFANIVIRAHLQAQDLIQIVCPGGEHNNGAIEER